MGHRKKHAPRRGSLAYLPRGRASRAIGRIRYWPTVTEGPTLLAFTGYKAGMTHVFLVEDQEGSPNFGKEIMHSATVLDAPPITACALKAYTKNQTGLQTLTEAWTQDTPKDLNRNFTQPEKPDPESALKKIKDNLDKITEFRLVIATQPRLASGVPKKKPDIMEIKIDGGTTKEQALHSPSGWSAGGWSGGPRSLCDVHRHDDARKVVTADRSQKPGAAGCAGLQGGLRRSYD